MNDVTYFIFWISLVGLLGVSYIIFLWWFGWRLIKEVRKVGELIST
jgi:hypothetical protein